MFRVVHRLPTAFLFTVAALPAAAGGLSEALVGGTPSLDLRWRYENVSAPAADAEAATVRTRLGYRSGEWAGWSAFAEFEDVHEAGADDYTTPSNGALATSKGPKAAGRAVVADPVGTELNQAYLQYRGAGAVLRYGRQRIVRDDARFVGNVGWRQAEQTFDGFSAEWRQEAGWQAFAAYLTRRNTITFTTIDQDTRLFEIGHAAVLGGMLKLFRYDVRNDTAGAERWETTGVRFSPAFGPVKLTAVFARQEQETGASPGYARLAVDWTVGDGGLLAGFERLANDGAAAFQTPLATLHAYNGWADRFLVTPASGLDDAFLGARWRFGAHGVQLVFHDYAADAGSADLGSEWNGAWTWAFAERWKLGAKFASYRQGDAAPEDVDKAWLWLEFSL
ncbi:MAG: hypothetical protein KatS3mg121_0198 [Gammaproteobacteria bacterium]|nr:MAG: hypothetical protein KatS3mg121_0198 [Gammaproteobacteria bacterium]